MTTFVPFRPSAAWRSAARVPTRSCRATTRRGIPLVEGYAELVREGDALAGEQGEHVGKVKL